MSLKADIIVTGERQELVLKALLGLRIYFSSLEIGKGKMNLVTLVA